MAAGVPATGAFSKSLRLSCRPTHEVCAAWLYKVGKNILQADA